ncbi:hypothetical protein TNCV_873001 [Trichonephila clavipes]|nr:hypothetical protein TNCV_873001 [Trichonephila clavipes]
MYFGSLENVVDLSSGRNTKAYIHNSTDRKTHIKYPPFKWGCRLVIIIYKPIPFPGISSLFSIAPNRWIPIALQCNFVAQFPPKEGTPSSEDANSQRELILPRVKRYSRIFNMSHNCTTWVLLVLHRENPSTWTGVRARKFCTRPALNHLRHLSPAIT